MRQNMQKHWGRAVRTIRLTISDKSTVFTLNEECLMDRTNAIQTVKALHNLAKAFLSFDTSFFMPEQNVSFPLHDFEMEKWDSGLYWERFQEGDVDSHISFAMPSSHSTSEFHSIHLLGIMHRKDESNSDPNDRPALASGP
jgi:hypothetical protein